MEFQTVLDAVRSLAAEDRVRLVHLIQNELQAEGVDPDLTPAAVQEVKRRLAAFEADPSVGVPWEEVEARMQKQLKDQARSERLAKAHLSTRDEISKWQ